MTEFPACMRETMPAMVATAEGTAADSVSPDGALDCQVL